MKTISAVIPVYNSEHTLIPLSNLLIEELASLTDTFEIIFVDDYSRDDSWKVITSLIATDKRIKGFRLSRNYGQHNALLCGIRSAKNEVILTLDDDLQHPPSEIRVLMERLNEGYDVVYGTPNREQHGFFRDLASRLTKITLKNSMGIKNANSVSAFRVFFTDLREAFSNYKSPTVSIDVLLTWATSNFSAVKVEHHARYSGESNYSLYKLLTHAFNMMTGFSTKPLQISSIMGFVLTLFGFFILAWVVSQALFFGTTVPGFPFLASIVSIFSGAQLFALGVIGEYIARIHFRTLEMPAYVVRETLSSDNKHD